MALTKTLKAGGDFTTVAAMLAFVKTYNWSDSLEVHVGNSESFGTANDVNAILLDNDPSGKTLTIKTDPAVPTSLGTILGRFTRASDANLNLVIRQLKIGYNVTTVGYIHHLWSPAAQPSFQTKLVDLHFAQYQADKANYQAYIFTKLGGTDVKLGEMTDCTCPWTYNIDEDQGQTTIHLENGLFYNNLFLTHSSNGNTQIVVMSNTIKPHKNNTFFNYEENGEVIINSPLNFTNNVIDTDPNLAGGSFGSGVSVATLLAFNIQPTASSAAILNNADPATSDSHDIIGAYRGTVVDRGAYEYYTEPEPILCWNYRARYKNSNRLYTTRGAGPFPRELRVPSNVDVSTGCMMDKGQLINPDQFKTIT